MRFGLKHLKKIMITLFMSIYLEETFFQLRPVGSYDKSINCRNRFQFDYYNLLRWMQSFTTYNKYFGWIVCKSYQGLQKIYSMDL